MEETEIYLDSVLEDPRFIKALTLFNNAEWYEAHDAFEELWHETSGPERRTLQGLLQVSVAQLHLERGNLKGATILYGEGLGRLKDPGTPDLGLNIADFCIWIETRLQILQKNRDPEDRTVPALRQRPVVRR